MPDIFDEVSEDLRAERAQQMLKKYGGLLAAAAVLVLAATGGWQAWKWHESREAARVATTSKGHAFSENGTAGTLVIYANAPIVTNGAVSPIARLIAMMHPVKTPLIEYGRM